MKLDKCCLGLDYAGKISSCNKLNDMVPTTTNTPFISTLLKAAIVPGVVLTGVGLVWELWVRLADVKTYLVPLPSAVVGRILGDVGYFVGHGSVTVIEATMGFVLGAFVAFAAASLMAHSKSLERALYPLALLVKVTPVVAIAPLFVIWFGFGSFPKILIAALITFFPMLVNTVIGLRHVDRTALDFFNSLGASRWEIFIKLRIPSSMPYVFAAVRIAVPLSIIGAVVGEWFTGDRGLGSVIIVAHNDIDTLTLFAAIVVLAIIGVSATTLAAFVERRVIFWHESMVLM